MKKTLHLKLAIFIALVGLFTLPAFAQKVRRIDVGKSGRFHIDSPVKIGDKILKAGMYRIQRLLSGNEHFIVIREVEMNRNGRSMGSLKLGDEIARSKYEAQSVGKHNRNAKILVLRNTAGERVAVEVWFRGENVRYILASD